MVGENKEKPNNRSQSGRESENRRDDSSNPVNKPERYEEQYGTRDLDRSKILQK